MNIIVLGINDLFKSLYENDLLYGTNILAFTDIQAHSEKKISYKNLDFPLISINEINNYDYSFIISLYDERTTIEIKKKLGQYINNIIPYSQYVNSIVISRLNMKNKKNNSPEEAECLSYIINESSMQPNVFNYPFIKNYNTENYKVYFDAECQLYYVMYKDKKMYMKRSYTSEKAVLNYVVGIETEQDIDSPHCYFSQNILFKDKIVIDAGVAEGNFALSIIDDVKKIYLVECDDEWLEALHKTFEPYKEKVIFINKFLSDTSFNNTISVDDMVNGENIGFIKMDIEGAETDALIGAENTIKNSSDIKLAVCAYHRHNDEKIITALLKSFGISVKYSKGLMLFIWEESFYKNPEFRHGLVWGEKLETDK